jgi:hypothetical protein
LLLLLLCYLRLLALALSFFVFRHLVSMDCLGTYVGGVHVTGFEFSRSGV